MTCENVFFLRLWPLYPPPPPPSKQAFAGILWQIILHKHPIRGVQVKEKVCKNCNQKNSWIVLVLTSEILNVIYFSTRQYTVPDPPGLFDGHVWPMYLKHRHDMENCGLPIGTVCPLVLQTLDFDSKPHFRININFVTSASTEYLDGLKTKDEIYNQVHEDIHNTLLNRL